jgi:hypothetical protein
MRKGGIVTAAVAAAFAVPPATPSVADDGGRAIKHVLVISVDGMHQADLDWVLKNRKNSTLAKLVATGRYCGSPTTPTLQGRRWPGWKCTGANDY